MRATTGKAPAKAQTKKTATRGNASAAAATIDPTALFSPTGLAEELTKTAEALTAAIENGEFCAAMDRNVALWVAIKTLVGRCNGALDNEARSILIQAADQVASATFAMARNFTPEAVVPLIGTNIEVAKALVSGVYDQIIRDRAYYLWQESGQPIGNDQQFWFTAEREIKEAATA